MNRLPADETLQAFHTEFPAKPGIADTAEGKFQFDGAIVVNPHGTCAQLAGDVNCSTGIATTDDAGG